MHTIYDQYAGMLYGYIFEVVKDKQLAERYLMMVFNDLPHQLHDLLQPGVNVYHKLQQLTRKHLKDIFGSQQTIIDGTGVNGHIPARPNKFLDKMSAEQKHVFCNIHYYGKSVSTVAAEMNSAEEEVRKVLQQAFAAIRRVA
ncbi:sigma-70 family RNA polymerase sigma factor [Mucilaginibacter myungsuensis]|uniref:Sigma-70 family RNA polymerase sigma factor n=1 Tax=Mucilaginibacter myungsuensis TaxID=649104 RepID=A0A929KXQ2_9SPHI|nr:sigma-70 family RNA polymerase sigma factor [Mucilaginibacter myungsuensis]MBE9663579.1 sigma-70 family RNA polymerase sigma factor [Mucilaginibacter myungsuensis]MDN3599097.1 sigma-70 family RNA polymerase sigma factor [Mucilaginibacter myungsuensis]